MMPASPSGFVSSQTSSRSASRSSTSPLSSVSVSPARGKRTTIAPSRRRVVVGVHRLAELEHHVVGDVDDGADRADARALEPRLHPGRRRAPRVDALDHAAAEARAACGRRRRAPRGAPRSSPAPPTCRARRASRRSRAATVARHAEHRQAVGAIRRELEREDRVVERERVAQVGPGASVAVEREQARPRRRTARVPSPSRACRATRRRAPSRADRRARRAASRLRARTAPSCRRRRSARRTRSRAARRRRRPCTRAAGPRWDAATTVEDARDDDARRTAGRRSRSPRPRGRPS